MKFTLIIPLCLYTLDLFSKANTNPCREQKFESGTDEALTAQYKRQYGALNSLKRDLTGGSKTFKEEDKKEICACAMEKTSKQAYDDLLKTMETTNEETYITIAYLWYKPFLYTIPSVKCTSGSGSDQIIISKGFTKVALFKSEYDIYVGKAIDEEKGGFVGIIRNVDA